MQLEKAALNMVKGLGVIGLFVVSVYMLLGDLFIFWVRMIVWAFFFGFIHALTPDEPVKSGMVFFAIGFIVANIIHWVYEIFTTDESFTAQWFKKMLTGKASHDR
jgi:hypothetical protein